MGQPYVGEIRIFAGNFAPLGWAFCDGSLLAISQNDVLFQLIGTTFGGDGQQTFALPNLSSRVPLHQGQGPGTSPRVLGEVFGVESVTLTVNQIPSHTHPAPCSASGTSAAPGNNFFAADGSGNIAPYSMQGANSAMAATAIAPSTGAVSPTRMSSRSSS